MFTHCTWSDDDVDALRVPLGRDVCGHLSVLLGRAPQVPAPVVAQAAERGGRRHQSHHCAGEEERYQPCFGPHIGTDH